MTQKIVHIIFSLQTGGAELMLIDIINEQIKNNKVILVVVNDYDEHILDQLDKGVEIVLLGRNQGSKNPYYIIKLNLIVKSINSDVIHCHNVNMIDLFFLPSIKKKMILTIHDTSIKYDKYNKYCLLFAISKAVQIDLKKRYNLNSILIYNGINANKIDKKVYFNRENDIFKIVQISRLDHKKKGQDILIKAIHRLTNKNLNINVDFIGIGQSESHLKTLVSDLKLEDRIRFLGLKDRAYIYSHLNEYDLLVQPSVYEGFGLTVAEAMLAKVRVLVSNIEGPMEVINNGEYGYFFESENVDSLASCLENIITSPSKYKLVENAYRYAEKNFNIESTAKCYLEEYNRISK